MSTKRKKVAYRQIRVLGIAPYDGGFGRLVIDYVARYPQNRHRKFENQGKNDALMFAKVRQLDRYRDCVGGVLIRYKPNESQAILSFADDENDVSLTTLSTESLPDVYEEDVVQSDQSVEAKTPDHSEQVAKEKEFVVGMLYFVARGNHIAFIEHQHCRSFHLEEAIDKIYHTPMGTLGSEEVAQLVPLPPHELRAYEGKVEVKIPAILKAGSPRRRTKPRKNKGRIAVSAAKVAEMLNMNDLFNEDAKVLFSERVSGGTGIKGTFSFVEDVQPGDDGSDIIEVIRMLRNAGEALLWEIHASGSVETCERILQWGNVDVEFNDENRMIVFIDAYEKIAEWLETEIAADRIYNLTQ